MSSTGNSMAGKVAFITGGGTGIGAAVAAQFVAAGGRVVLMGRRLAQLEAVAAKLGGLAVAGDAASTGDVRRALAQAREKFGRVDVLVANAGGHGHGHLGGGVDHGQIAAAHGRLLAAVDVVAAPALRQQAHLAEVLDRQVSQIHEKSPGRCVERKEGSAVTAWPAPRAACR